MSSTSRREFFKNAALSTSLAAAPALGAFQGANDRINLGVVGIRGRGRDHIRAFARVPGVRVAYLCDVDERLFPERFAEVEKLIGAKPTTFTDMRKLLEQKDLDAISIATPDHWHALCTIWACQAGKDVYCEKPVCHNLREGRKMVEAARKYNRIVQAGLNRRSEVRNMAGRAVRAGGQVRPGVPRQGGGVSRPREHRPRAGVVHSERRELGPVPRPGAVPRVHAEPLPLRLALLLGHRHHRDGQ